MLKIIRAILLVSLVVSATSTKPELESRGLKRTFCEIETDLNEQSHKLSPSYQSSAATTTDSLDSPKSFILDVRPPTSSSLNGDGSPSPLDSISMHNVAVQASFDDEEFDFFEETLLEEKGMSVEERAKMPEFWKMDETDPEESMISLMMDEHIYKCLNEKHTLCLCWSSLFALDWKRDGQVKQRQLSAAALFIRAKAYVLLRNTEQWTADEAKFLVELEEYISYGVDLDMPVSSADISYQGTFLHSALSYAPFDSPKMTQMLLRRGASVEILNSNNESPLFIAIRRGHLGSVRVLIEAGADPNYYLPGTKNTPLLVFALHYNQFEVFKYLLSLPQCDVNIRYGNGQHITAFAVALNLPQYLKAIFDCPRMVLNYVQLYALFVLCNQENNREMFRFITMKSLGSNSVPISALQSIFASFIRDGVVMGVEEFLANGLKPDFKMKLGKHFLSLTHYAALRNRPEILQVFSNAGMDLNTVSTEGFTPAIVALHAGAFDAFRYLIPHLNHLGVEQCLKTAIRKGLVEIVDALATAHPQSLIDFRSTFNANLLEYVNTFKQLEIYHLLTTKFNLKQE